MADQLTEQKLTEILLEVKKLAEQNDKLSTEEFIKEIEFRLLNGNSKEQKVLNVT